VTKVNRFYNGLGMRISGIAAGVMWYLLPACAGAFIGGKYDGCYEGTA
jgi:hypothetical protein